MVSNVLKKCAECESNFKSNKGFMESLCMECAHIIYGYPNCFHQFEAKICKHCGWEGKRTQYVKDLMEKRKIIILYDIDTPQLILPTESGVWYQNQVCGNNCLQMSMIGSLAPLGLFEEQNKKIEEYNYQQKIGLRDKDEEFLNNVFHKSKYLGGTYISVDSSKLKLSMEAWVYVKFDTSHKFFPFHNFTVNWGVLTWQNSD